MNQQLSTRLITGTFFQLDHWDDAEGVRFSDALRSLTADHWRQMLHDMYAIGIDTLVFQQSIDARRGADDLRSYYPSSHFKIVDFLKGRETLYSEIIDEADALGMKVIHSLYGMPPGMPDPYLETGRCLEIARITASELLELFGDRPSFGGWYWTFEYPPSSVSGRDSLRKIVPAIREIRDCDFMIAPNADRIFGASTLQDIDVDIVAYQDSVGLHARLDGYRFRRGSRYRNLAALPYIYEQIRYAHDGWTGKPWEEIDGNDCWNFYKRKKRTAFWNDLEIWEFDIHGALVPTEISRIMSQLELTAPYVDKQIIYQYPGLMHHPDHPIHVGGERAASLYEAYAQYYQDVCSGNTPKYP